MEALDQIRKYVQARGGKDTLSEEEKKALTDMAKKERREPPEPVKPGKRTAVNLNPTAEA